MMMYHITGNNNYLNHSHQLTKYILSKTDYSGATIKWVHAEHRTQPNNLAAQTGLMQGTAGIGLWLLKLHGQFTDRKPLIHLPDEPRIE